MLTYISFTTYIKEIKFYVYEIPTKHTINWQLQRVNEDLKYQLSTLIIVKSSPSTHTYQRGLLILKFEFRNEQLHFNWKCVVSTMFVFFMQENTLPAVVEKNINIGFISHTNWNCATKMLQPIT